MTLFCGQMVAQDIHFSQINATPLTTNPSNTGVYNGSLRVSSNYRSQWKYIDNKPFTTYSIGAEKQFNHYLHTYSIGIHLLSDESGYVGLIKNHALLSCSYGSRIGKHTFSIGMQGGVVFKQTNIRKFTFDDQFDLGGEEVFNPDFSTAETDKAPISYPVFNSGLSIKLWISKKIQPEIGFAIMNLNTPTESFFDLQTEEQKIHTKTLFTIGGKITVNQDFEILPTILISNQQKAAEYLLGGIVDYKYNSENKPFAGILFRSDFQTALDASSIIVGLEHKQIRCGLSYDVNVSSLQKATKNRGAFELSLIYITSSAKSNFIKIPCDRM